MTTVPDYTKSRTTAMTAASQIEPAPVTNASAPLKPIPSANQQPTINQSMMTPMDSYDSEEPCDWAKIAFYVGLLPATLIILWFSAFSFHAKAEIPTQTLLDKSRGYGPDGRDNVIVTSEKMHQIKLMLTETILTALVFICCISLSPAIKKSTWFKLLCLPTLAGAALYFSILTAIATKDVIEKFKEAVDPGGFAKAVLILKLIVVALLALSSAAVTIIGFLAYSSEFTSEQPQPMEQSPMNIGGYGWDGYNYRSAPYTYMLSANGQGQQQNTTTIGAGQQQNNTLQPSNIPSAMMTGNSKACM